MGERTIDVGPVHTLMECYCAGRRHPEAHDAAARLGRSWHYRCRLDCPHPDHLSAPPVAEEER